MQRRLVLLCAAIVGLTAMVLADRQYRAGLEQQNQQALAAAAESAAERLASALRLPNEVLHDLEVFLSVAEEPLNSQEFIRLATVLCAHYPWLRGIAYADATGIRHAYVPPGGGEALARHWLHSEAGARTEGKQAPVAAQGPVADGALLLSARRPPRGDSQGSSTLLVGVFDVVPLIEEALAAPGKGVRLQLRDASGTVFWGAPALDGEQHSVAVAAPKGAWTLALAGQIPAVRPSGSVLAGIWGVGVSLLFSLLVIAKRSSSARQRDGAPTHVAKVAPGTQLNQGTEQRVGGGQQLAAQDLGDSASRADAGAELEALTYTVSHDLRAPLRAMQGFAGALLEDCGEQLTPAGRDYARRIVEAGRRMDGLIEDLLTYSRITRREIRVRNVDLARVVRDVLDHELAEQLRACNAEVEVKGPLPEVRGHYATLVKIVGNLVANAIKFVSASQRPRIRIWAERIGIDSVSPVVRLWVEDNGIGIAAEKQQRIFKVFERLHGIESFPGTGMGLAVVRRGLERLGGRVGVVSAPGEGSRFWIELALADDASSAQTAEPLKEKEYG